MFIACPHCRYLVATDPRGRNAPAHCPRCGGVLGDAGARDDGQPATPSHGDAGDSGPSLARLLRRDEIVVAPVTAPTGTAPADVATAESDATESERVASGMIEPEVVDASVDDDRMPEDTALEPDTVPAHFEVPSDSLAGTPTGPAPVEAPVPAAAPGGRSRLRTPSFLHGHAHAQPPSTRTPRWQWATLSVLAIALVLQVLLADRARLAGDAGWRPALTTLCNALGCSLPPWREPQAFAMLDRDVRPVPGAPGVLLAQATFRNDARWSQPWPVLVLTLRDADGRTLGARAMHPAEYLPRDSAASTTLGPGQSAQVAVRVREPSANVVAFSFDFR